LSPERTDDEKSARSEAKRFLLAELADGAVATEELKKAARKAGIGERTLWTAKADLKVESRRLPGSKYWEWYIPTPAAGEPTLPVTTSVPVLDDLLEEVEL
jgi:hypothetical protein